LFIHPKNSACGSLKVIILNTVLIYPPNETQFYKTTNIIQPKKVKHPAREGDSKA
jgi:hypothetical protein